MGQDGSGDNLVMYSNGQAHCFACGAHSFPEGGDTDPVEDASVASNFAEPEPDPGDTFQYVPWRGVTRATMEAFNVKTKVNKDGQPITIYYPYSSGSSKARSREDKRFWWTGTTTNTLFGVGKFDQGSSRSITITEGELDALSVYQLLGSKYPVVSVRSASSAERDCGAERSYLNGFEKVYICFDNDKAGQDAAAEVARLFDPNKVRCVRLTKFKDPNDYLTNNCGDEFVKAWWAAKPFLPKNISNDHDIEAWLNAKDAETIGTYPFPTLDNMAYGIRAGELVLFTAQQKVGKTEVFRALEYHLLKTTPHNLGIIHLEEKEKRSVQGLAGYELGLPVHLPDSGATPDIVASGYRKAAGLGRVFYYTHFGSDDPGLIVDSIRYLVRACKCKFVFLDHLTMLVSGEVDNKKRETLDMLATKFAMLTRELDFTLFLISHVNDDGEPRDSRMIAKTCDLQVYLTRDKESADNETRNQLHLTVRDNRFAGTTGPAGVLTFDPKTWKLAERQLVFDPNV